MDDAGAKIEDDALAQPILDALNTAAWEEIRAVAGNERRMVIVTGLDTAFLPETRLDALLASLHRDLHDDPNILATVHYYSEWVYSGSLGRTGFDEPFRPESADPAERSATPRTHLRDLADNLNRHFTSRGIGVLIGEWGLLSYDTASDGALQAGEELKYYAAFLDMVRDNGFACAFWDNGTGIDRTDPAHGYPWRKPLVGEVMTAGLTGPSACARGLDTLYLPVSAENAARSPVRLGLETHGRTLVSVADGRGQLREGSDYTLDAGAAGASNAEGSSMDGTPADATLTLTAEYLSRVLSRKPGAGLVAELTLHFDGGADWHEWIRAVGQPQVSPTGPTSATLSQPAVSVMSGEAGTNRPPTRWPSSCIPSRRPAPTGSRSPERAPGESRSRCGSRAMS